MCCCRCCLYSLQIRVVSHGLFVRAGQVKAEQILPITTCICREDETVSVPTLRKQLERWLVREHSPPCDQHSPMASSALSSHRPAVTSFPLAFFAQRGSIKRTAVATRQRRCVCGATEDSEGKKKGGFDWDNAWSNFQEGLNRNIPEVQDRTARPAEPQPRVSSKSPQFARDSRKQLRENIKKQENLVLDFWSQELFFKVGGALIAVLLLFFLVIGGPDR